MTFTYYMGFISQSGHFKQLGGTLRYDPAAAEGASIEAAIKTGSLSASSWKSELKGSDFFDTANFPEIRFKSRSARRTGETSAEFTGDLTMKGVTRPIALQAEIKNRTHVTATTSIKRSDFNMTALATSSATPSISRSRANSSKNRPAPAFPTEEVPGGMAPLRKDTADGGDGWHRPLSECPKTAEKPGTLGPGLLEPAGEGLSGRRKPAPSAAGSRAAGVRRPHNLHIVSALAMLGDVETLALGLRGDAQADDHRDDEVDDQAANRGPADGDGRVLELDENLRPHVVIADRAVGRTTPSFTTHFV